MPSSRPKVDALLGNAKWHEERKMLRAILLARQLTEEVKWGKLCYWSSPGLMDTFHPKNESVFHAENEEPVPCGIQGTDGCAGASWAQC